MTIQVIASIASMPSRTKNLELVIDCILKQVDQIHVYLNNYEIVPKYLKNTKIKVYTSEHYGDLADIGKFFPLQSYNDEAFLFTLDDDLLYPPNYVRVMIEKIEQYQRKAFICVHGNLLPKALLKSYYNDKMGIHFAKSLRDDISVDIPGTGTLAFYSKLYTVDIKHFIRPFMTDIWLYKIASERKIPVVAIERPPRWITSSISLNDVFSIYDRFSNNDCIPTDLINSIKQGECL